MWLQAFAVYEKYFGREIPKTIWISKKIREKVQKIKEREEAHYTSSSQKNPSAAEARKKKIPINSIESLLKKPLFWLVYRAIVVRMLCR